LLDEKDEIMKLYKPKDHHGRNRKNWYITFCSNGIRRRMAISTNKKATEKIAAAIDGILACNGSLTPELQIFIEGMNPQLRSKLLSFGVIRKEHVPETSKHAHKLLTAHIADFTDSLRAADVKEKYASQVQRTLIKIFKACDFEDIEDVDAHAVYKHLADMRGDNGIGQSTFNTYLGAVKQFFRWMIEEKRTAKNPLEHLKRVTQTEKRRQRRALTLDEQRRLIEATANEPEHSNLTGPVRALLYRTALQTGLRANELRSLTVSCFNFKTRTITLTQGYTKNKKTAILTMPQPLAADIQAYVANKLPNTQVFRVRRAPSLMIERDHAAAGIEYKTDEGTADFHSLRHSFITNLARAGVHPSDAMALARHSTITLTMNYYTHTERKSLQGIIDALPDLTTGVPDECPKRA
jgi:integrase